jgi:MFS family permease
VCRVFQQGLPACWPLPCWSAADAVPRLRHEAIFLLVFALDLVNMFIATVAYPALAAELHADVGTLAWVGTAYMLGLSVVIPLAPWLAARCGARLLLVALLLFAVAAVLAGAAPGIGWLLGWRLQGAWPVAC